MEDQLVAQHRSSGFTILFIEDVAIDKRPGGLTWIAIGI
jgi:hypothetical protein